MRSKDHVRQECRLSLEDDGCTAALCRVVSFLRSSAAAALSRLKTLLLCSSRFEIIKHSGNAISLEYHAAVSYRFKTKHNAIHSSAISF